MVGCTTRTIARAQSLLVYVDGEPGDAVPFAGAAAASASSPSSSSSSSAPKLKPNHPPPAPPVRLWGSDDDEAGWLGFTIGGAPDWPALRMDGEVDAVRVWGGALTHAQVAAAMLDSWKVSSPRPSSPLHAPRVVGSWHLNEGSGEVFSDSGPDRRHGTLTAAPNAAGVGDGGGPEWITSEAPMFLAPRPSPPVMTTTTTTKGGAVVGVAGTNSGVTTLAVFHFQSGGDGGGGEGGREATGSALLLFPCPWCRFPRSESCYCVVQWFRSYPCGREQMGGANSPIAAVEESVATRGDGGGGEATRTAAAPSRTQTIRVGHPPLLGRRDCSAGWGPRGRGEMGRIARGG